jgi:hypothetical protein
LYREIPFDAHDAGATLAWMQTSASGALEHWSNYHTYMLRPEQVKERLEGLDF